MTSPCHAMKDSPNHDELITIVFSMSCYPTVMWVDHYNLHGVPQRRAAVQLLSFLTCSATKIVFGDTWHSPTPLGGHKHQKHKSTYSTRWIDLCNPFFDPPRTFRDRPVPKTGHFLLAEYLQNHEVSDRAVYTIRISIKFSTNPCSQFSTSFLWHGCPHSLWNISGVWRHSVSAAVPDIVIFNKLWLKHMLSMMLIMIMWCIFTLCLQVNHWPVFARWRHSATPSRTMFINMW